MTVTEIEAKDVPVGAKKQGDLAQASQQLIKGLVPGKAVKVEPTGTETVRGLRVSLTRAAKAVGVEVQITKSEDALYVQLDTVGVEG